eukprot:13921827-Heterocapsa_arctica.AAC.1
MDLRHFFGNNMFVDPAQISVTGNFAGAYTQFSSQESCLLGRRPWKVLAGIRQFEFGRPRDHHSIPYTTMIMLHEF